MNTAILKLIDNIAFKFGYVKIQRPTASQIMQESHARKTSLQKVTVTAEFPIDVYKTTVTRELIPKLGEAMLPYVDEEFYFNKQQGVSRFTWTINFAINPFKQ